MKKGFYKAIAIISLILGILGGFLGFLFSLFVFLFEGFSLGSPVSAFLISIVVSLLIFGSIITISVLSLISLKNSDPLNIFSKKINLFYFILNLVVVIFVLLIILLVIIGISIS